MYSLIRMKSAFGIRLPAAAWIFLAAAASLPLLAEMGIRKGVSARSDADIQAEGDPPPAPVDWTDVPFEKEIPPDSFKVAFLGDQGLGPASESTLELVLKEKAHVLVHLGDFDYQGNPAAWEAQTDRILGRDFPQIAVVGNHDIPYWTGVNGYGRYVRERLSRMGVSVEGEAGMQCAFHYKGIFFVLTSPGIAGGGHPEFIRGQLESDSSLWRISAWHVNQSRMQAGLKGDEAGWGVYEESRKGGAIIATAHEHSYSRTHLLGDVLRQEVASRDRTLRLRKGRTFVFVSGLGGGEVRPQALSGDWWASIYTATQGATHGALFGMFNVDGNPRKAHFYFKNINGSVIDSFDVVSEVDRPSGEPTEKGISVRASFPRTLQLDPAALGFPRGGAIRIQDLSGRTLAYYGSLRHPVAIPLGGTGLVLLRIESGNRLLLRKIIVLP